MKGVFCEIKDCEWNKDGLCILDSIDITKKGVCDDIYIENLMVKSENKEVYKGWTKNKILIQLHTLKLVAEELGEDELSYDIYEIIEKHKGDE